MTRAPAWMCQKWPRRPRCPGRNGRRHGRRRPIHCLTAPGQNRKGGREWTCKPGSVPDRGFPDRRRPFLYGGNCSTPLAVYPEVDGGPDRPAEATTVAPCSLLDLAPGGACLARLVAQPAGALLPHRFTLAPRGTCPAGRFAFCCTFPGLTAGGRYPSPCPSEPGLSSCRQPFCGSR